MSDEITPCPGCAVMSSEDYDGQGSCWNCASKRFVKPEPESRERRVVLTRASEITPEPVLWLWACRLPLRGLSIMAGEPGLGKSTTTAELAALVSRGALPGDLDGVPRDVLLATAEDHWESVVWGRLKAARADMDRVHRVSIEDPNDAGGLLTLPDDVAKIDAACAQLVAAGSPPALIVIDPVSAYIGSRTDTHRDAAVRRVLAPLQDLGHDHRLAVLGVSHLNKDQAGKLLDRVNGSVAFGAAPRSVLAFARDPEDGEGERGSRRVIVHAKTNNGKYARTLAAHIEEAHIPVVGSVSRLVIDGECDIGPEDLRPVNQEQRLEANEAASWLANELGDGGWHRSATVAAQAKAEGITAKMLRRARERMEVEDRRVGFPAATEWRLPAAPSPGHAPGFDADGRNRGASAPPRDSSPPARQSCPPRVTRHDWPDPDAERERILAKFPDLADLLS